MRGIAGVGAVGDANGAKSNSTSSASSLSSASPSEMWDMTLLVSGPFGFLGDSFLKSFCVRRPRGDSAARRIVSRSGLDCWLVFLPSPSADLRPEVFGVRGVADPMEDADDGGRGMADCAADEDAAVFTAFIGRGGEILWFKGEFSFGEGTLTAVKLTRKVAR